MAILELETLHREFGARVLGIDLSADIDAEAIQEILDAMDKYSMLVFPNQEMGDEAQLRLTQSLGTPEANHLRLGREGVVDYFLDIGNVQVDGSVLGNNDQLIKFLAGNNYWHSDSSFREVPTRFSLMYAYEVPKMGGETQFASTRTAYERLSEDTKALLEPLVVVHDYVYSRSKVAPVDPNHAASLPPARQKLVRTNPATGDKNYYLGSHAKTVVGWEENTAQELLAGLLEQATLPQHVYTHHWEAGQLVMWDNRCLLHRGLGYDADLFRRRMRQTRVAGSSSTLLEA